MIISLGLEAWKAALAAHAQAEGRQSIDINQNIIPQALSDLPGINIQD